MHKKPACEVIASVSSMANPFVSDHEELVCISSGVEVPTDVAERILCAEQIGENQFSELCQSNLFSDNPDIFTKITKNKLQTSPLKKLMAKDVKDHQVAMKTSRDLFARLLILSKARESEYPLSLATVLEGLVKTAKVKMFEILQGMTVNYGGPQLSRQKQIHHGKSKFTMAKASSPRQKQIHHGKSKFTTAKANHSRQKQIGHGNIKSNNWLAVWSAVLQYFVLQFMFPSCRLRAISG